MLPPHSILQKFLTDGYIMAVTFAQLFPCREFRFCSPHLLQSNPQEGSSVQTDATGYLWQLVPQFKWDEPVPHLASNNIVRLVQVILTLLVLLFNCFVLSRFPRRGILTSQCLVKAFPPGVPT